MYFFFQAEDGIRDRLVTGVQTCALPILNITFAHPSDPSLYPSLHVSNKKYNNGSSVFSASLSPDGEYCYVSTVNVTEVNTQNCNDISILKAAEDSTLKVTVYADGDYSRSEEHTSELQSQAYLVCRLLLEKKKKDRIYVRCENL